MLAEIFMMRLEAAARVSQGAAPVSNPRFVPYYCADLLEQKKGVVNRDAGGPLENRTLISFRGARERSSW